MISGVQVDAWGAFVPNQGKQIEKLRKGVVTEVKKRGLKDLKISTGEMAMSDTMLGSLVGEKREYTFFQQKFGTSANATFALRIARRGKNDMEISWRLLESNPAMSIFLGLSQTTLVWLGGSFALFGLIILPVGGFIMVGLGVWLLGMGLGWWRGTSNKSRLTTDQMLDARVLGQTIDYCLMKQLEKLGVSASELKILQAAQMEGIGMLGKKSGRGVRR